MPPIFNEDKCVKCQKCIVTCPGYILEMGEKSPQVAFPDECWHCGCCRVACGNRETITFEFPLYTLL